MLNRLHIRKQLAVVTIITAMAAQLCSGQGTGFEWAKAVDGALGFGQRSVAVDAEGHLYAVGYFRDTLSFGTDGALPPIVSAGEQDAFILKLSPAGELIWAKTLSGLDNVYGFSVAVDGEGMVYVGGFFEGTVDFDPGPDTFRLSSEGLLDVFIQKMDGAGNFLWAKTMGGLNNELLYALCADEAGNVYATGWFADSADFDPNDGSTMLSSAGLADVFVQKLDRDGNLLWATSFGGESSDEGFAICLDGLGNVYTAGWFYGTLDFDAGPQAESLVSQGEKDIFVHKLDTDGNFQWAQAFGGPQDDHAYSIAADDSNDIYLAGSYRDTLDFGAEAQLDRLASAGRADVLALKMDGEGKVIWAKSMGGPSEDEGRSIAVDSQGSAYLLGYFRGEADFDPGLETYKLVSAGAWDVFVQKLDKDGYFQWAKSFGGPSNVKGYAIGLGDAGRVYAAGMFEGTVDFNPEGTAATLSTVDPNAFFYKMNQDEPSSTRALLQRDSLSIFPNPTQGGFQVDLGEDYQRIHVKITNIKGQQVFERRYQNQRRFRIEMPGQPTGVYFVEVVTEREALVGRLIVRD